MPKHSKAHPTQAPVPTQTQDFLGWEEDEDNDLQDLIRIPSTMPRSQQIHTQADCHDYNNNNSPSVGAKKEVEKEVDGIFNVLNDDSNKNLKPRGGRSVAGFRHRKRRQHTREKIQKLNSSLHDVNRNKNYSIGESRKKRRCTVNEKNKSITSFFAARKETLPGQTVKDKCETVDMKCNGDFTSLLNEIEDDINVKKDPPSLSSNAPSQAKLNVPDPPITNNVSNDVQVQFDNRNIDVKVTKNNHHSKQMLDASTSRINSNVSSTPQINSGYMHVGTDAKESGAATADSITSPTNVPKHPQIHNSRRNMRIRSHNVSASCDPHKKDDLQNILSDLASKPHSSNDFQHQITNKTNRNKQSSTTNHNKFALNTNDSSKNVKTLCNSRADSARNLIHNTKEKTNSTVSYKESDILFETNLKSRCYDSSHTNISNVSRPDSLRSDDRTKNNCDEKQGKENRDHLKKTPGSLLCETQSKLTPTDNKSRAHPQSLGCIEKTKRNNYGEKNENESDPFGEIVFDEKSLAMMDGLVSAASQKNKDAVHERSSFSRENSSTSKKLNIEKVEVSDPFGDLPMIDFDEMDKLIAQRSSINSSTERANCHSKTNDSDAKKDPLQFKAPCHSKPVQNPLVERTLDNAGVEFTSFSRYKIHDVVDDCMTYTKTLTVSSYISASYEHGEENITSQSHNYIFLRGEWYHTRISSGDVIHLVSVSGRWRTDFSALPIIMHTNPPLGSIEDDLLLILNPDMLVTPTLISETVSCSRRAVINYKKGSAGLSGKFAVVGTMRHDLFEKCIQHSDFSMDSAKSFAKNIVKTRAETLVGCSMNDDEAYHAIIQIVPQLQRFAQTFMLSNGDLNAGALLKSHAYQKDILIHANNVFATEESAVSAELGLKGFVDATLIASSKEVVNNIISNSPELTSLMAVELKTGHNQKIQEHHMAQLSLYTLMLRTRHGSAVIRPDKRDLGAANGGMLLYLNHDGFNASHVSPSVGEVKSLIGQRNLLTTEIRLSVKPRGVIENDGNLEESDERYAEPRIKILPATPAELPDVLMSSHPCNHCFSNRECMLHLKSQISHVEDQTAFGYVTKSHKHLLNHFTSHLSDIEISYFREWDRMIDLEANATERNIAKSWLVPSLEREKKTGKCISSLRLNEHLLASQLARASKGTSNLIPIQFERANNFTPLINLRIEVGNRAVISTDDTIFHEENIATSESNGTNRQIKRYRRQMHLIRGSVEAIKETTIVLLVSKGDSDRLNKMIRSKLLRFRLDIDDTTVGIGTLRQNLMNMFIADIPDFTTAKKVTSKDHLPNFFIQKRMTWLRKAVIHLSLIPKFDPTISKVMFSSNTEYSVEGCDFMDLAMEFSELNYDQRGAVTKVFTAQDYALVQGLPGTGKSSTIAFVARLLAAHGKRVLITSYTHTAVDNLIIKLMDSGVSTSMIRIGPKSKCHDKVHSILVNTVAASRDGASSCVSSPSAKSLRNVVSAARIVGVSALTIPRSALLVGQHFDVVIVDEAGQISQPAILGVLMAADSFVLVGDHMQLPPLVVSDAAEQAGYGVSMMKRLVDVHPGSCAQLTLQYRMHGDINELCNQIVYNGALKCANEKVESDTLQLPHYPAKLPKPKYSNIQEWLAQVLNPDRAVVFVDTDMIEAVTPNQSMLPNAKEEQPFTGLEEARGRRNDGNIVNETENILVRQLVHGFFECGFDVSDVGIICPIRSQLRMMNEDPFYTKFKQLGLELSTIDKFQGRDKSVIILSLVRSNIRGKSGRLLNDFRRLNVAVSRAKRKLIIIGSFQTMHRGSQVLRPILETMKSKMWIVTLAQNAHIAYDSNVCIQNDAHEGDTSTMPGFWDDVSECTSSKTNSDEKVQFRLAGSKTVLNVTSQQMRDTEHVLV